MRNLPAALANIPNPSEKRIALRVSAEAERAIRGGHPWLFAGAVQKQTQEGKAGDLAVIFDRKGRFLAIGLYDPFSQIRVRVLHIGRPTPIDQLWFAMQIAYAESVRSILVEENTTGYRLIHGENDGLPGLIVDRYEETYVIKLYSAAWIVHLKIVLSALMEQTGGNRFILRFSRQLQKETEALYGLEDGSILIGSPLNAPVTFLENGLTFSCDPIQGQKTGFFLDQRENRKRVELLSSSMCVLNVFSYTGGFSLYAARGGAKEVTSLDLSRPALEMADHQFELNAHLTNVAAASHQIIQGDAFERMQALAAKGVKYDMVILDPPAFANRRAEISGALNAYRRLAQLGLRLLSPGGILVAASCSRPVKADDFFQAVGQAARSQKRVLHEIERTGHAIDHPISFRDGAYLKCLFAEVR